MVSFIRAVVLIIMLIFSSWLQVKGQSRNVLKGAFWKQQALEQVIPGWEKHVFNEQTGGFHTYLKRDWTPYKHNRQYPGMIARQLFSFSAAYLLSGDAHYLKLADSTFQYLVKHGWDKEYGGWYEQIGPQGQVIRAKKDLFMQTYAITGLTMYYATTRNPTAKTYLKRSYALLREYAWDTKNQGYYDALSRSLSIANAQKDFSPQLAPASGFLTYLYPITRKSKYKTHFQTLLDMAWEKMRHPSKPWIMESFTKNWQMIKGQNEAMNVGHNLEVVWLMARLYQLTGKPMYKQKALQLNKPLTKQAFHHKTGAWYHKIPVDNPDERDSTASWWVQAYGNMTQLYLYRITQRDNFLNRFKKGARFWNKAFLDERYGGTVLKTDFEGNIAKGAKAVRTKTAYHAIEHGLLNYLYLRLWVEEKPAKLHYQLTNTEQGQTFYPVFLANPQARIKLVTINGEVWNQFDPEEQTIQLPEADKLKIQVKLQ